MGTGDGLVGVAGPEHHESWDPSPSLRSTLLTTPPQGHCQAQDQEPHGAQSVRELADSELGAGEQPWEPLKPTSPMATPLLCC